MKLHEKALANALALVASLYYIICVMLVYIVPDFYKSIAASWAHVADISGIWAVTPPDIVTMVWGFITFTAFAWISGFLFGSLYNYFIKRLIK